MFVSWVTGFPSKKITMKSFSRRIQPSSGNRVHGPGEPGLQLRVGWGPYVSVGCIFKSLPLQIWGDHYCNGKTKCGISLAVLTVFKDLYFFQTEHSFWNNNNHLDPSADLLCAKSLKTRVLFSVVQQLCEVKENCCVWFDIAKKALRALRTSKQPQDCSLT